jgi:tRNA(fMet)-specific endonuclease VapC
MKFLLDTNICIYIIKKRPADVINRFKNIDPGDIAISSITLAELQFGVMKSSDPVRNQEALNKFITPLEIVDFDYFDTLEYGKTRAYLESKGTPIGPLDTLIASQALSKGLILVSNNLKEFSRIPDLVMENWL